jgi:exopolysaccharide biosynthesis polyprenyl glycosylphosphotransferase
MTQGVLPELAAAREPVIRQGAGRSVRLAANRVQLVAEAGRAGLVWLALVVVYGSQHSLSQHASLTITLAAAVWLVALRVSSSPECVLFGRVLSGALGAGLGLAVVVALNGTTAGLQLTGPWLVACAFAVAASAIVWDSFVCRVLAARKRVLLVGTDGLVEELVAELRGSGQPRFDVVASENGAGELGGSAELARIVEAQQPDIVVLTDEEGYGDALDRLIDARANVRVSSVASFFEYAFGRVPIEHITPAWFMSLVHPRQHVYTGFSKRTFDVLVAALGLLLAAPVLAMFALLTKATSGRVFYRQTRVGEGGRYFTLYKLRTMACDAEDHGPCFSCFDDPRPTRIGRALRRAHIDELPQLWNVLRGDMSIVGPRPERPEFIDMIEAAVPFWSRRLLVKPGITGWAQIQADYASDCDGMARKLSYDLWYLRHRSLLVDFAVCLSTCFAVLARRT